MKIILEELIGYTASHFELEEQYMTRYAYPEYKGHKAIHDKLVGQVLELKSAVAAGKNIISIDLMNFLKDWLQNHIMSIDKKLGAFLSQKKGTV